MNIFTVISIFLRNYPQFKPACVLKGKEYCPMGEKDLPLSFHPSLTHMSTLHPQSYTQEKKIDHTAQCGKKFISQINNRNSLLFPFALVER